MRKTVSATEARVHFGELMQTVVDTREPIIVERGGKPKVAIISIEQYNELEAFQGDTGATPHWRILQAQVREMIRRKGNVPLTPPPDEVIRQMREERDAQITNLP